MLGVVVTVHRVWRWKVHQSLFSILWGSEASSQASAW